MIYIIILLFFKKHLHKSNTKYMLDMFWNIFRFKSRDLAELLFYLFEPLGYLYICV